MKINRDFLTKENIFYGVIFILLWVLQDVYVEKYYPHASLSKTIMASKEFNLIVIFVSLAIFFLCITVMFLKNWWHKRVPPRPKSTDSPDGAPPSHGDTDATDYPPPT